MQARRETQPIERPLRRKPLTYLTKDRHFPGRPLDPADSVDCEAGVDDVALFCAGCDQAILLGLC